MAWLKANERGGPGAKEANQWGGGSHIHTQAYLEGAAVGLFPDALEELRERWGEGGTRSLLWCIEPFAPKGGRGAVSGRCGASRRFALRCMCAFGALDVGRRGNFYGRPNDAVART